MSKINLRKKLNILLILLLVFGAVASAAYGAVLCSLTVKLADDNGAAVSGVDVEIFRVADFNGSDFTVTSSFTDAGVTKDDLIQGNGASAASKLDQYVFSHNMSGTVCSTDSSGNAEFFGLEQGIYLVTERGNQAVSFHPYLVILPDMMNGLHQYIVTSQPKISETDTMALRVTIKWVDNNDAAGLRPDGVIVQLLNENTQTGLANLFRAVRGSSVLKMVNISEDMNWTYVFKGLDKNGVYDVLQLPVQGYDTSYSGSASEGFVITNIITDQGTGPWYPDPEEPDKPDEPGEPDSPDEPDEPETPEKPDKPSKPDKPKIPQTGAILWPVYMMLAAGVILCGLGIFDLYKGGQKR